MKHNTPSTGKFLKLVRKLRSVVGPIGCVSIEVVATGLLERLWHITITSAPLGDIGKLDNDEIAELIGWTGDADGLIDIMVETGWLDRSEDHRLVVHDWHEHAPNHIKNNVKRWQRSFASLGKPTDAKEPPKEGAKEDPGEPPKEPPKEHPRTGAVPNLTKPNQTKPPPPTPSEGWRSPKGEAYEQERRAVAVEISDLGVERLDCFTSAINAGLSLGEIRLVVKHFRENSQAMDWGAAALYDRLLVAVPGQPPDRGWPLPSLKSKRDQERESRSEKVTQQALQRRTHQQADREAYEQLEAEFGDVLDAMNIEEVLQMAAALNASMVQIIRNKGRPSGISVRRPLLNEIKKLKSA